jgi:hypothetical protein
MASASRVIAKCCPSDFLFQDTLSSKKKVDNPSMSWVVRSLRHFTRSTFLVRDCRQSFSLQEVYSLMGTSVGNCIFLAVIDVEQHRRSSQLTYRSYVNLYMASTQHSHDAGAADRAGLKGTFRLRSYQAEMVEESLKANIIVAMDTGSGKTHMYTVSAEKARY